MSDTLEAEQTDPKGPYRRLTKGEALKIVPLVFTLTMVLGVLWDSAFGDAIDFESSFYRAIYAGMVLPAAFMVFKIKSVGR